MLTSKVLLVLIVLVSIMSNQFVYKNFRERPENTPARSTLIETIKNAFRMDYVEKPAKPLDVAVVAGYHDLVCEGSH